MDAATSARPRIAIIGSGFSGLCLGIQLQKAGIGSFTIFEKADRIGGTWRDNTLSRRRLRRPVVRLLLLVRAEDRLVAEVVAASGDPRATWRTARASTACCAHIRFGTEIAGGALRRRSAASGACARAAARRSTPTCWSAASASSIGPAMPRHPGLEPLRGERFHSARWNHGYDLAGKRVAVDRQRRERDPVHPADRAAASRTSPSSSAAPTGCCRAATAPTREREKRRFARCPLAGAALPLVDLARLSRCAFPCSGGNAFLGPRTRRRSPSEYLRDSDRRSGAARRAHPRLPDRRQAHPDLRRLLRGAATRPNVELVIEPIDHVDARRRGDARRRATHPLDALILATGFETTSFLAPMRIEGVGRPLARRCLASRAPRAYRGITVAGFPNLFLMYGPNTNLGHNSIIFMIECQTQLHHRLPAPDARARARLRSTCAAPRCERLQRAAAARARRAPSWAAHGPQLVQDRRRDASPTTGRAPRCATGGRRGAPICAPTTRFPRARETLDRPRKRRSAPSGPAAARSARPGSTAPGSGRRRRPAARRGPPCRRARRGAPRAPRAQQHAREQQRGRES